MLRQVQHDAKLACCYLLLLGVGVFFQGVLVEGLFVFDVDCSPVLQGFGHGAERAARDLLARFHATQNLNVQEVVFVIRDGKAVLTPVKTGISDFQNIEILSGVKPGEQVASGPFRAVAKTLKDGARVDIKDEKTLNKEALKEDGEGK